MARFDVYPDAGDHSLNTPYLLEVPKMGAVPKRILKTPVTLLVEEQVKIISALDFLFQGY